MPIFAAAASFIDDAAFMLQRMLGRSTGSDVLPYQNPKQLIAALNNPATEKAAVARMKKLHYGAFYNSANKRTMFSGMAEAELLNKGKGWSGAVFGRPVKGLSIGMAHVGAAIQFSPLTGLLGAYTAPKKHKLSGFVGGVASSIAFGVGDLVGTTLGGPIAGFALGMVTEKIGRAVGEGVQAFNEFAHIVKHVNMGGNYEDTEIAYTMRQRAAIEMGSSVMNARSWLGKEAILMHQ